MTETEQIVTLDRPDAQVCQVQATVDFAEPKVVKSMSGFLHGIRAEQPPAATYLHLRPQLWRTGHREIFDRILASGARLEFVLSDTWGYRWDQPYPWEDYSKWEAHVRRIAREHRQRPMLWDVWNEPNLVQADGGFWKGTREQFFETYRRAYRVLREELGPDVMIGGPSITEYDREFLVAFLDFCVNNHCEVNFLSWHELTDFAFIDRYVDIPAVADHLRDARRTLLENPAYASLQMREIQVNEFVGPVAQLYPGDVLGFLYYLEDGGADGACRACWSDPSTGYSNGSDTLDGLLSPGDFAFRAGWWAQRYYAEGVDSRVTARTSNPQLAVMGSRASGTAHDAQVLIGYMDNYHQPPAAISVTVHLEHLSSVPSLSGAKHVRISTVIIPDAGEESLPLLPDVNAMPVTVKDGSAQVVITTLALHQGCLLLISADQQ
jgi:hypothetical protein